MADEKWHDFATEAPPERGHIVTGDRRPDGTWRITGIHPPGTGRDNRMRGEHWASLPDWIIQGPPR